MSDLYWARVRACLREFHSWDAPTALKVANATRSSFAEPTDKHRPDEEAIEHIEPFSMACLLAKNELDLAEHVEKYKKLLEQTRNREEREQEKQREAELARAMSEERERFRKRLSKPRKTKPYSAELAAAMLGKMATKAAGSAQRKGKSAGGKKAAR